MIAAAELAGFCTAHAIWCVEDGDTLVPLLAYTAKDGQRTMERFAHDDLDAAIEFGRRKLASNELDATAAVLIYDGRIPMEGGQCNALVIEMRSYLSPDSEAKIAVPYTSISSGKFRVHRPQILDWQKCDDFDLAAVMESFFKGVASHDKGSAIWNQGLDESR